MTAKPLRGADIVARTLECLGVSKVFTLSGNHIMSIFDAALETKIDLVHVRHEAASVHMADAWGRLTGEPGIAMVTGGPGHANAVGALYTALAAESPMVLISGHAATWEHGRGGFQEIAQADMARPVTKASWTATSAETLGLDIAKAMQIARSGRPGPVHISLPSDLLDAHVEANAIRWPETSSAQAPRLPLSTAVADATLATVLGAARPLILGAPQLANGSGRALLAKLEAATNVPCLPMESVRGFNDATIGAFATAARKADVIVLLGKALDFTLKWAQAPAFAADCKIIMLDPEGSIVERAVKEKGEAIILAAVCDTRPATETLIARAATMKKHDNKWLKEVHAALATRLEGSDTVVSKTPGRLHPAEVFRALRPYIERDPSTILICDGGEFSQWGQAMLPVPERRMINGVAGAIGSALSVALAARVADAKAPIFAVLGDGTIGFHISEFETGMRRNLPFIAILGNDACWNAESQIQLRDYGRERMHGCDILPARYDLVCAAFGGHGENVERAEDLPGAIERAIASGKPACINIMTESIASPAAKAS